MNATLKDIAPCQKELKVEVPLATVEAEFEVVYRELKKKAHVPGFRVGFAPRDLLEKHHGSKAKEEVLRRLIAHSLQEALSSQGKLDLVGRPQVTEVHFDPKEPLTYLAQLEVAPQVPLGRYKKLALTRHKIQVSEEEVSQVLTRLQDQQAQLKPVLEPRATQEGDFLLVDLSEASPGKSPVKRQDVVIHLDLKKNPDGAFKTLVGMIPGEKRQVKLEKDLLVTVNLKQIKAKEVSPLDDSFAKAVGSFETLQALKEAIAKGLEQEAQGSQQMALQAQVSQQLLQGWAFEVPPSLVASQARRLLKEQALELMGQGIPASQVQERAQVLTEQAKLEALKQVKLFFILRSVAEQEQVSATQEQVEARIEALAKRLNTSPEEVRKDLESRDLLEDLIWSITRAKVLDLIIQEAELLT